MRKLLLPVILFSLLPMRPLAAADPGFLSSAAALVQNAPGFALSGSAPGWLFLKDDVLHASKGEFWKEASPAPIEIITKFRESLSQSGVTLLLVPVPSKAAMYPDKLLPAAAPDAAFPSTPYLEQLKKTGATVIDLEGIFRRARNTTPVFCATDSHWSPAGIVLAAEAIAADPALVPLARPGPYVTGLPEAFTFTGDLAAAGGVPGIAQEEVNLTRAGLRANEAPEPVPAAATGPVILLGDSHTMVFTDGASRGMHLQGAGLRDHLQVKLGFPLVQISNQNSGGTGARRLFQQRSSSNPGLMKEAKVVIWVFSIREFSLGKWR